MIRKHVHSFLYFLFWFVVAFFATTFAIEPHWIEARGSLPVWARWSVGLTALAMLVIEVILILDEQGPQGCSNEGKGPDFAGSLVRKPHN